MLKAKNLMVFFENALALNDLSLEVREGEIVAVLGSNSAGKTTLMNTISGLIVTWKRRREGVGENNDHGELNIRRGNLHLPARESRGDRA
jgi:ABC-type multidrug transport system ATPase subunit